MGRRFQLPVSGSQQGHSQSLFAAERSSAYRGGFERRL